MPAIGHAVVCGLDHLGLRTIDELRARDEVVVGIGPTADAEEHLTEIGARLVIGDPRLTRVLREAEVESAAVIVLTGEDDLANLNAALAAFELNPTIRMVIRMFDQELGAHIPTLFPDAVALSSSALAAPGFVSAAIDGETGTRFELAGRVITSRESADAALSPHSVVIARLKEGRAVDPLPDAAVGDPDLILVDVSEPHEGDSSRGAMPVPPPRPPAHRSAHPPANRRQKVVPGVLGSRFASPEERLMRFAIALVVLAIVSALFFEVVASLSPLDAISYVITLLTGAALPANTDPVAANTALRVYAILLSLVGAAIVAVVYAFITDALIRSRLLQTLGRRTVPGGIHDHVIVAGLGSIGYRVALGIAARGVPVVAIEVSDDGRFVSPARAAGIPVLIGDARHPEVLQQLHIGTARALVAATSDDLVNLSAALNARALVRDDQFRVVVRLYDPAFAVRVQQGFKIRFTRSVSQLAAPAFAAAAIRSEVVATVPVGDKRVILFARLRVPAGSKLEGRLASSLGRVGALRILAVADPGSNEARWDFPADEVMDADEEVVVAATRAGLGELLHLAANRADPSPGSADAVSRA
jgi:Trk K+ transport system NAD-binding subunit